MSLVTTIVLISKNSDQKGVQQLEAWARARETSTINRFTLGESLAIRNTKTGGSKFPEINIHASGWNYFPDPEGLIAEFNSILWEQPESAFLVVQPQEGPARVERPPFTDDW